MNLDAAALLEQAGRFARLLEHESDGDRFDEATSDGPIRVASDQDAVRALAEITVDPARGGRADQARR